MCKSPNKQGWEIYNFENVPSLFVNSKKVRFINLHFFATFLQICSFQKSDCAIALLVACTKNVIVHLHFEEATIKCNKQVGQLPFWKYAIALFIEQKSAVWNFALFLHICSFQKSDCAIAPFCTFEKCKKMWLHICSFERSDKKGQSHFWEEQQKCDCTISTFEKSNKKSDCTINIWKRATKSAIAPSNFWKRENVQSRNVRLPSPSDYNWFENKAWRTNIRTNETKKCFCFCSNVIWK